MEVPTPFFTPSPFAGTSCVRERRPHLHAVHWSVLALGIATLSAILGAVFLG